MGECYGQLILSERIYIQSQLELGFKAAAIAAALKREPPRSAASCGAMGGGVQHGVTLRWRDELYPLMGIRRVGRSSGLRQRPRCPECRVGLYPVRPCGRWWLTIFAPVSVPSRLRLHSNAWLRRWLPFNSRMRPSIRPSTP